jgi:CxxC motif-containing protein (DUF1111 family)
MKAKEIGTCILGLLLCGCKTQQEPKPGEPLQGLTPEQMAQFAHGKKVFQRVFVPEDGLGPLFNGNSCAECHENPAVGGSGDEVEVHATRFNGVGACDELFQEGGPVIQQDATPLLRAKGIQKEAVPPLAIAGRRSSPPVFGLGLVDAISEVSILLRERPPGSTPGGIHGHANRSIDGRVGRFGRKAAVAALFDFNAGAFPQEMGITTPLAPTEETINGTPVPPETDPAPDPEISLEDLEGVTAFVRFLAPPPQQTFTNYQDRKLARHGQKLFKQLACAECHVPKMQTARSAIKALDRKWVNLYSDLLLHDMGPESADICLQQAGPQEFRTEMLMGLRFREQFLHNGSAGTVQEAIEGHGGEAQASRDRFKGLSLYNKAALLKFLQKL